MKERRKLMSLFSMILVISMFFVSIPAQAYTPSVSAKKSPELVKETDEDGDDAGAIIYDEDGNEIDSIDEGDIILTPYSDKDDNGDEIKDRLEETYDEIKSTPLEDILSDDDEEYLEENGIKISEMEILDIFDFTITDEEALKTLKKTGNQMKVTFDTDLEPDDFLMVMMKTGDTWKRIPDSCIFRNDDGTVSILVDDVGVFMFLTTNDTIQVASDGPSSPQTSDDGFMRSLAGIGLLSAGIFAGFLALRKREIH